LPIVASLNRMLWHTGQIKTWLTRHGDPPIIVRHSDDRRIIQASRSGQAVNDRRKMSLTPLLQG
jgi:hypothetical protein